MRFKLHFDLTLFFLPPDFLHILTGNNQMKFNFRNCISTQDWHWRVFVHLLVSNDKILLIDHSNIHISILQTCSIFIINFVLHVEHFNQNVCVLLDYVKNISDREPRLSTSSSFSELNIPLQLVETMFHGPLQLVAKTTKLRLIFYFFSIIWIFSYFLTIMIF